MNSNSNLESKLKTPRNKPLYQQKKTKTEGKSSLKVPVIQNRNSILRKTEANNKIRELLKEI